MYLTKEEERILSGENGEMLSKLLKLIVELGDSYGAEKLIEIKSAHTVLNFGLNFVNSASEILSKIADAGLKVKVRTTADPNLDMDYEEALSTVIGMYQLQDQLYNDLTRIGVSGYTCTPYFLDNRPQKGDHCAWSESSAVIYLNSVIGGRSNREGGIVDIASAITTKTPYYGLHLDENRKGKILYKLALDDWSTYDLTSFGLFIGETAGTDIPVIDGVKGLNFDNLKNLGAATAASGAVALIHVIGLTPEASDMEEAFGDKKPMEVIEVEQKDLDDMREKYTTNWDKAPQNISIGCPHLSKTEVIEVIEKLKGKKILDDRNFWICCNDQIKEEILASEYNQILKLSGAKITSLCPLLVPLSRPLITNSAKTCNYSNATYVDIDECVKIATEGK